jgi:CHASE2 domain-containing sensor protein
MMRMSGDARMKGRGGIREMTSIQLVWVYISCLITCCISLFLGGWFPVLGVILFSLATVGVMIDYYNNTHNLDEMIR